MFTIFSDAHFGQVVINARSALTVFRHVDRLVKRGDTNIRVGSSPTDCVPFEIWRQAQTVAPGKPTGRSPP